MVGKYEINVSTRRVKYIINIKRKYTIIRGDSATGKTQLCRLIAAPDSCNISCEVKVAVLQDGIVPWQTVLKNTSGMILFVDEDFIGLRDSSFSSLVNASDNYFVFVTRKNIRGLSCSVDEVYQLNSTRRYNTLTSAYTTETRNEIFYVHDRLKQPCKPDIIMLEDSNSGYEFFKRNSTVECISCNGNGNIDSQIRKCDIDGKIAVIADAAALGMCMDGILEAAASSKSEIHILLPESFEYLLLRHNVVDCPKEYLTQTYDYADEKTVKQLFPELGDVRCVISWERFFTYVLIGLSMRQLREKRAIYSKSSNLSRYYDKAASAIFEELGIEACVIKEIPKKIKKTEE